jgi:hypothetical protein
MPGTGVHVAIRVRRARHLLVHPHDDGKVGGGESVTSAEHGERNLPGRSLAFQPALLDPQNQGGFFGRIYGWYALAVMHSGQLSSV